MRRGLGSIVCGLALSLVAWTGEGVTRTWTFDDDASGAAPRGFTPAGGDWMVVKTETGHVLAQQAKNSSSMFNLALADGVQAKEVDLTVKLRAVAGELDQGGGLVWRARDAKNYYIARYNPLEDNFRVYTVVDGIRSKPLQSADVPRQEGWRTLRVTMTGDHITGYLDGTKFLDVHDRTFPAGGTIGVWSKADAQSQFDDLSLRAD